MSLEQRRAFEALVDARKRRDRAALSSLMLGDGPEDARAAAASTLVKLFGHDAVPELAMALDTDNETLRATAAWRLYRLKSRTAAELLARHLDDPSDHVTCWCMAALPLLGDSVATREASVRVDSAGPSTRARAIANLLDSRRPEALPALARVSSRDMTRIQ